MRFLAIVALFVAIGGLAFAQDVPPPNRNVPVTPVFVGHDEDPPPGGAPPSSVSDADRDGFVAMYDCNEDDPDVNPGKLEAVNGLDDDCNGVVDDGFDTTIDWPQIKMSIEVWPVPGGMNPDEAISTEAKPRVVWAEDRFLAVWIDLRGRLRLARIAPDGTLLVPPSYLRKPVRSVDVAWTGSRLGIVYEDTLTGTPAVRLMLVDRFGLVQDDVVLAAVGSEPKVAWGQDRFGVVWRTPGGTGRDLTFQRFDPTGRPLSREEPLVNSGGNASIAYSGSAMTKVSEAGFDVHEGWFGIAYEAYDPSGTSGQVLLSARPRDAEASAPIGPVAVNQQDDPYTIVGAMPAIAANPAGFMVAWHASEEGADKAQARFFSLERLAPVQAFTPDADAGRYGRMLWTGGEFVMANDNRTLPAAGELDVHVRRLDPSGNTHRAAGWGPWSELRLRDTVKGGVSSHPDIATCGEALGVVWVEADEPLASDRGRLWLAIVTHK